MGRTQDNPSTTTVNEAEMVGVSIILSGSGQTAKKGTVLMPRGVADYFGVTVAAPDTSHKLISRANNGRKVFKGLWDDTGTNSASTGTDKFYLPARLDFEGGGKLIIIPTAKTYQKTTNGKTRTVLRLTSMRFPTKAILSQISDWLYTNCVTHKPGWFKTVSGSRYIVAAKPAGVTDLNPGNEAGG